MQHLTLLWSLPFKPTLSLLAFFPESISFLQRAQIYSSILSPFKPTVSLLAFFPESISFLRVQIYSSILSPFHKYAWGYLTSAAAPKLFLQ